MKSIDTFEKAWTLYQLDIPLHWGDYEMLRRAGIDTEFPPYDVVEAKLEKHREETVRQNFDRYGFAVEVEEADDEQ